MRDATVSSFFLTTRSLSNATEILLMNVLCSAAAVRGSFSSREQFVRVACHCRLLKMSKHQNKQDAWELIRSRLLRSPTQRFSRQFRLLTDSVENQTKRKTLSKLSMIGFNGAGVPFHRRGDRLKVPKYQNTYRLEPFRAFHAVAVDKIVRDVMEAKLSVITSYQPDQTSKLCLDIAADVLKAVGKKDYDRCKMVTQVYIIQRFQQSIHAAFQCFWDVERDNYSYHTFENDHIYAWCCVFGIYYD